MRIYLFLMTKIKTFSDIKDTMIVLPVGQKTGYLWYITLSKLRRNSITQVLLFFHACYFAFKHSSMNNRNFKLKLILKSNEYVTANV